MADLVKLSSMKNRAVCRGVERHACVDVSVSAVRPNPLSVVARIHFMVSVAWSPRIRFSSSCPLMKFHGQNMIAYLTLSDWWLKPEWGRHTKKQIRVVYCMWACMVAWGLAPRRNHKRRSVYFGTATETVRTRTNSKSCRLTVC